jgi:phosphohistidine phosphatase
MNLIVVRHGRAGSSAKFAARGLSDDLRPLTAKGRKRMRRNAEGLAQLIGQLDALAASPLARAMETAQIIAKVFDILPPEEVADLAPGGDRAKVVEWITRQPMTATVMIVGHEPSLSGLVAWLVCGADRPLLELKKGAACCVELSRVDAGTGELRWLMTPRQLRRYRV